MTQGVGPSSLSSWHILCLPHESDSDLTVSLCTQKSKCQTSKSQMSDWLEGQSISLPLPYWEKPTLVHTDSSLRLSVDFIMDIDDARNAFPEQPTFIIVEAKRTSRSNVTSAEAELLGLLRSQLIRR